LRGLPESKDPKLLVGFNLADDAGVYKLSAELALVQTVDVFTPVVDDAYDFGQIAAANALSDIYAMGARPVTALNIAAFPRQSLPFEILGEILRGGFDKVLEADAVVAGGHTVENAEPLFGLAVTGVAHPDRIATNAGACPGDVLVLTKPIGTGIISTAIKREACSAEIAQTAIDSMKTLNRAACETMIEIGIGPAVHACTDITGFGLLGHAAEMARASQVMLQIEADKVPLLPGVEELARGGQFVTGGGARNAAHLGDFVQGAELLPEALRHVFFDPQTSGGLLIAIAPEFVQDFLQGLKYHQVPGKVIGMVASGPAKIQLIS
jgi:selenide,water dikinase